MVPKSSSNRLNIEKVNFHETSAGVVLGAVPGLQESTQDSPRSPQDGSKIVLDRFFHLLIFRFDFVSFSVPFWCRFGLPNGAPGVVLDCASRPLGVQDGLEIVLVRFSCRLVVRDRFGGHLGVVLGRSWVRFGPWDAPKSCPRAPREPLRPSKTPSKSRQDTL